MRCNFPTVYGWKTAFSIRTNRTDRQAVSPPCLWLDLNYILSPLNQMQFSDRIQIENNLLLTVKQYRSKSCFIGPYQIVCIGQPSTFCASRKPWFKRVGALGLTLTQSTTPPSTREKLKQNFPIVNRSILMNLYLNQELPNGSVSLITNCLHRPAEHLAVIFRKLH